MHTKKRRRCSSKPPQKPAMRRGLALFEPLSAKDRLWDAYISIFGVPALSSAVESGDRAPIHPENARSGRGGRTHG